MIARLIIALFLFTTNAFAVEPAEMLKDNALEARARLLSKELRCLVCQNQSIDDSDALLAKDLRTLVRERIISGDSNDEVIDFVVKRYGDFVLLRPPFKFLTAALWTGPAIILITSAAVILFLLRRRKKTTGNAVRPLNSDERALVQDLLAEPNKHDP